MTSQKIKNSERWLSPNLSLFLAGSVLAVLFACFYLLRGYFSFLGSRDIPPSGAYANILFLFLVLLIFLAYYFSYRILAKKVSLRLIVLFFILFSIILLLVFPFASADVFLYIFYPKIFLAYHDNPYFMPLNCYAGDIFFKSGYLIKAWVNQPLAYGPVWLFSSSLFTFWSLNSAVSAVAAFKLMAWFLLLVSSWLLYKILARLKPEEKVLSLALWLWSPLILFEVVNNAHNDIVMVFFTLLAVYLLIKEKYFWVLPVFLCSLLIKYFNVILLPFLLIYLWKNWGKRNHDGWLSSIIMALIVLCLWWLPFWQGPETLKGAALFNNVIYNYKGLSLVAVLAKGFYAKWVANIALVMPTMDFIRWVCRAVFSYFYLSLLWQSLKKLNSVNDLLKYWSLAFLFFFLIFTVYLQTWYFVLPLAILALVKGWPYRWYLGITMFGLLNYFLMSVDLTIIFLLLIIVDFYFHSYKNTTPYVGVTDEDN